MGLRADRHARCHRKALGCSRSERTTAHRTVPPDPRHHRRWAAVAFSATGTTVDDDGSRSLLDAGESGRGPDALGLPDGHLFRLRRSAAARRRPRPAYGALTTANDGDGVVVQTCVSAAAGDCDIDL